MRRWFILAYTLHFLLSVGFFAFGQVHVHHPERAPASHSASLADDLRHPAHADDLMGAAADHGLTDSQPELPEFMASPTPRLHAQGLQARPIDLAWTEPPSAVLKHPHRPPRQTG